MVNDQQVRKLKNMLHNNKTLKESALCSGMDEKTARKYRDLSELPSELISVHTWKTRKDPFEDHWEEIQTILEEAAGIEAKALFMHLQRTYPGYYQDNQLRTLQRKIKRWRATEGPPKEVMFTQEHPPGELGQSDFTHMKALQITIAGQPFEHLIYHFVLTCSNWESGSVCFSESFESLSDGLQKALWELGGVPLEHQTDRLTAAVNNSCNSEEFTERYSSLMKYYGMTPRRINAGKSNENGDVEQSHYRFKKHVEQELLLRGSRDFQSRSEYEKFLKSIFAVRNAGRKNLFAAERTHLQPLPAKKIDSFKKEIVRVSKSSTILVNHNHYSVRSQLIGENVQVYLYAEHLEIWYAGAKIDTLPRLRGSGKYKIQYRHIIDSLVRKPGAFRNYRYRAEMFPSTYFKRAYDHLQNKHTVQKAAKEYLSILHLAAKENESRVNEILLNFIQEGKDITYEQVHSEFFSVRYTGNKTDVHIDMPFLGAYDELLSSHEEAACHCLN
jgi:hypothetical protein